MLEAIVAQIDPTVNAMPGDGHWNSLTCSACGDRCGYLFDGERCLSCELALPDPEPEPGPMSGSVFAVFVTYAGSDPVRLFDFDLKSNATAYVRERNEAAPLFDDPTHYEVRLLDRRGPTQEALAGLCRECGRHAAPYGVCLLCQPPAEDYDGEEEPDVVLGAGINLYLI